MANIMSSALSGLLATQRSLDTIGHNIANVNTEGYSRQRVEITARPPEYTALGYIGTGSSYTSVRRDYDGLVEGQLRDAGAEAGRYSSMSGVTSRVSELLGSGVNNLGAQLQSFFNSLSDVSTNASSLATRTTLTSSAQTMASRFNSLDTQLGALDDELRTQISQSVRDVNGYTQEIATLNAKISEAYQRNPNALPNDLLDRRDLLVRKVAEKVDIQTFEDANGSISIYVGNGQPLVLGAKAVEMSATVTPDWTLISINGSNVTSGIRGGELGGLIEARTQGVARLRTEIGQLATAFVNAFNTQHAQGVDLNGNAGRDDVFSIGSFTTNASAPVVNVAAAPGNAGAATLSYQVNDATQLQATDYTYTWTGSAWRVTDAYSGSEVTPPLPGIDVTIGGGAPATGDQFMVRAARNPAGDIPNGQLIKLNLSDAREWAAAAAGSPADSKDNQNMQALMGIAKQAGVIGGASTLDVAWASVESRIGALARGNTLASDAATTSLKNLTDRRETTAGVNLDEEAANLLKMQQTYQALARAISVADNLFQSVLQAVG